LPAWNCRAAALLQRPIGSGRGWGLYGRNSREKAVAGVFRNRVPILKNATVITIAIENRSGKISNRFSFHNRIPIFPVKSICDFHLQIGSRLKTGFGTTSADGT